MESYLQPLGFSDFSFFRRCLYNYCKKQKPSRPRMACHQQEWVYSIWLSWGRDVWDVTYESRQSKCANSTKLIHQLLLWCNVSFFHHFTSLIHGCTFTAVGCPVSCFCLTSSRNIEVCSEDYPKQRLTLVARRDEWVPLQRSQANWISPATVD